MRSVMRCTCTNVSSEWVFCLQSKNGLLVEQEQVFLRCAAHSRQDLEDQVLYIDSALVGG